MASRDSHLSKTREIAQFVQHLETSRFPEWGIVGIFYWALHLTDAWLAEELSIHPTNHINRNNLVREYLPEIAINYSALYILGRRARYETTSMTDSQYNQAYVEHFEPLQAYLSHLLQVL